MKKSLYLVGLLAILSVFLIVGCSQETAPQQAEQPEESEFTYYTAEQLKQSIEANKSITIVDIQVEEEFNQHHIKGAIPTYAYPVKTEEEKVKLDPVLPELKDSENPIIIVCPGGKNGAQRTYQYFLENEIAKDRLFILENGQSGWPYDELLEK